MRRQVSKLGLEDKILFDGFLSGAELAGRLSSALGLILVSHSETWGLVVSEATALGLPVIISEAPGSRDALVCNLVSGFVVETGSVEGLAFAMTRLASDPVIWQAMSDAARDRAWLGDVGCFADSIELLFYPGSTSARQRLELHCAELKIPLPFK